MTVALTGTCPLCDRDLALRYRRSDRQPFVGCVGYPACHYTCDYDVVLERLHDEMEELRRHSKAAAPESVRKRLRELVFRFHPDRAGASVATHDVVAALNELLDRTR